MHVVDHRRLAEQALDRRQRRLEAHHAALAFEALEQRGLFAADVGAGRRAHFEVERAGRCPARRRRGSRAAFATLDRLAQRRDRRADTRSAGRCSPCVAPTATPAIVMPSISTNGSPSMIMRSEKVPESPSSALQTMYFWSAGAPSTVFHLMPVGNAAPPRPRRPESVTVVDDLLAASAPARSRRPR